MPSTPQQHRAALQAHASRLDRYLKGELAVESWRPIRLSYGLYYQLDHTSHMQRIKVPGGHMTAEQLERLAECTDLYGRGIGHWTTRQALQLHWVPVEQIIGMYERLLEVGITTRGACADTVRNVTACPFAGVAPKEAFDITPYVTAIHEYFLFNPLNLTLPRKFKIAVEGCPDDCAECPINDIALYAKVRDDGARGFSVHSGGGLGAQPFLAVPVAEWIPADDLLIWCEAIMRVQHRHGERKNRHKARMKYVVKRLGVEGFRKLVEADVARVTSERGDALRAEVRETVASHRVAAAAKPAAPAARAPGFDRWAATNSRPQQQAGFRTAMIQLPLGDLTSDQMRGIARLARTYGNGTLRATIDQNLVVPWVPEASLPAFHSGLVEIGLANPDVSTIADVVSCPGMDYCSLAVTRSMGMAEHIRAHLLRDGEDFPARLGQFGVKISGCPNSCGQHHVGDIGLTGHSVTGDDGLQRPSYSVLVGGAVGEGTARVGKRLGRFTEAEAPAAVAGIARHYERERKPGETFAAFVDRVGLPALNEVAKAATAQAAPAA